MDIKIIEIIKIFQFSALHRLLKVYIPNHVRLNARKSTALSSEEMKPPNITLSSQTIYFYDRNLALKLK